VKNIVAAAFLEKLARHLGLLVCLAIVAKASGWADPSQASILLLTVLATTAHWCGRAVACIRRERPYR
jgi:hypothetical protein